MPRTALRIPSLLSFLLLIACLSTDQAARAGEIPWRASTESFSVVQPTVLAAADLEGDGDLDIVSGSFEDDNLLWWDNPEVEGGTWVERTIDAEINGPTAIAAGDIDGDFERDVVAVQSIDSGYWVAWWRNLGGGTGWQRCTVQAVDSSFNFAHSAALGDVDGDGDLDIFGGSLLGTILWWEKLDDAAGSACDSWQAHTVDTGFGGVLGVSSSDVDGDGDLDLLAAGSGAQTVGWWENDAGDGSSWTARTIANGLSGVRSVQPGDIDEDGDPDVVVAVQGTDDLVWYENLDGTGTSWSGRAIDLELDGVSSVLVADADGDGDVDVLSTAEFADDVTYWENADGAGGAWLERTITGDFEGALAVSAGDVDRDGDLDVFGAAAEADAVTWWINDTLHRSAVFPPERFTLDEDIDLFSTGDVDGDGKLDVIGAPGDYLAWWRNPDQTGASWSENAIAESFLDPDTIAVADLDGDGDADVVSSRQLQASPFDPELVWWENVDGTGTSWSSTLIDDEFLTVRILFAADVDGDGDIDLVGSDGSSEIEWWENASGDATTWTAHEIEPSFTHNTIHVADHNGDGLLDVVAASILSDTLTWWPNPGNGSSPWPRVEIDPNFVRAGSSAAGDLDGDGDLDLMAIGTSQLAWWENRDGLGDFAKRDIDEEIFNGRFVSAADFDRDGDLDVVAYDALASIRDVLWWENDNGDATAWNRRVVEDQIGGLNALLTEDVDDDGDPDVLGVSNNQGLLWWQNRGGQFGLATRDVVADTMPGEGTHDVAVLEIQAFHRGRAGDGDLELVTFELLFEEATDDPLTSEELASLVDVVRVYRDDGDGVFETDGSDNAFFATVAPFELDEGVFTATFIDGETDVQLSHGDTDVVFFVALDLADGGGNVLPNTLQVTHLTESSSTGEMSATNIPLTLEYAANITSSPITSQDVPGEIAIDPLSLSFPDHPVSAGPSTPMDLTITNEGPGTLTILEVQFSGDTADFVIGPLSGAPAIESGGSRTISVAFDPASVGTKTATIHITSDDADEGTIDVAVMGTGVSPLIRVEPLILSFGHQSIEAGPTAPRDVVITNAGSFPLTIASVDLGDTEDFAISSDSGETVLDPGASRTVAVVFDPSTSGDKSATLQVASDDIAAPVVDVALRGQAVDPAEVIFWDGFDSGDTAAWSTTVTTP